MWCWEETGVCAPPVCVCVCVFVHICHFDLYPGACDKPTHGTWQATLCTEPVIRIWLPLSRSWTLALADVWGFFFHHAPRCAFRAPLRLLFNVVWTSLLGVSQHANVMFPLIWIRTIRDKQRVYSKSRRKFKGLFCFIWDSLTSASIWIKLALARVVILLRTRLLATSTSRVAGIIFCHP